MTAVAVGAGHRTIVYASYALQHPDELEVVGVVDPNDLRRRRFAETHRIPAENQFASVEDLVKRPKMADAAINGTMDHLHVATSLPLLRAGYHLLLEKPVATSAADVRRLQKVAHQTRRTVMICHVLRYAPFYAAIRRRVAAGQIGDILSIRTVENVSYHHMATAFIRGKWASQARGGEFREERLGRWWYTVHRGLLAQVTWVVWSGSMIPATQPLVVSEERTCTCPQKGKSRD